MYFWSPLGVHLASDSRAPRFTFDNVSCPPLRVRCELSDLFGSLVLLSLVDLVEARLQKHGAAPARFYLETRWRFPLNYGTTVYLLTIGNCAWFAKPGV